MNALAKDFRADGSHEILVRLIEILAPGTADVVAFLECYFDESGTDDGSPVLCVAGYLFDKEECKQLDLKLKEVLDRYRLPFFRMSACAHNQRPFKHLSRDECIEVEKAMIGLINQHAMLGVAIAVNGPTIILGSRAPILPVMPIPFVAGRYLPAFALGSYGINFRAKLPTFSNLVMPVSRKLMP